MELLHEGEDSLEEIRARHQGDPIFHGLFAGSELTWNTVHWIANLFPAALTRLNGANVPFRLLLKLMVFVLGFAIVIPLYVVVAPIIQITLVGICMLLSLIRIGFYALFRRG